MKRIISVLLIAAMSLSLCACGAVPDGMDRKTYKYGKEALAVMDDYLAEKISDTEACEKLDEIRQNMDTHGEYLNEQVEKKMGGDHEKFQEALDKWSTNDMMSFTILIFTYGIKGEKRPNGQPYNCEDPRFILECYLLGTDMYKLLYN